MSIDLSLMRRSGSILGATLNYLVDECIRPGITSLDISNSAEEFIRSHEGAIPAFLGYRGFPAAACVSVNTQVVHTVPRSDVVLKEGDIVSVDCGVIYEEHYADACRTVGVGNIGPREKKLLKVTQESLTRGISAAHPGNHVGDISYAVQRHVERNRFKVSLEFVGHGIGKFLHGPPCVPNYGPPKQGELLEAGLCLAIEPVVFDGSTECTLEGDNWTVISKQGNLSAHFEDTVLITEEGPEILTR